MKYKSTFKLVIISKIFGWNYDKVSYHDSYQDAEKEYFKSGSTQPGKIMKFRNELPF